jgi:hypothetical protein
MATFPHEISGFALARSMLLDILIQAPQTAESSCIVAVVGTELKAVGFGDCQCYFQDIDRIQAQTVTVKRCRYINFFRSDVQIQSVHYQCR